MTQPPPPPGMSPGPAGDAPGHPGVVRTTGTVREGQPRRWGSLHFKSVFSPAWVLESVVSAGAIWAGFRFVGPHYHSPTIGDRFIAAGQGFIGVAILAGIVMALVAAVQVVTTPAKFARTIPVGAPMAAEFGPDAVSVSIGGYSRRADLAKVSAVRMHDDAMVVFAKGAARWRAVTLIPRELVPPQIADDYLTRFGPKPG